MPTFFGNTNNAQSVSTCFPGKAAITTGDARLLSIRFDSVNPTLTLDGNFLRHASIGSISNVTAEQGNTRSQAASATYGAGIVDGVTIGPIWTQKSISFGRVVWIPGVRYRPIAIGVDNTNESLDASNGTFSVSNSAYIENTPLVSSRVARRSSRRGAWWRLGTDSNTVQAITGGGAFSYRKANFDDNISYIDGSAWRLGSCQADAWNINLFGSLPQRRRASVF